MSPATLASSWADTDYVPPPDPAPQPATPHAGTPTAPSADAIAAAVPPGSWVTPSQPRWLRAVHTHPEIQTMHPRGHRSVDAVVWVIARFADWTDMTSLPGHPYIAEQTHLSERTVTRVVERLMRLGLLGRIEEGSTERYRTRLPDDHPDRISGNRRAHYVLTIPLLDKPITVFADDEHEHNDFNPSPGDTPPAADQLAEHDQTTPETPDTQQPQPQVNRPVDGTVYPSCTGRRPVLLAVDLPQERSTPLRACARAIRATPPETTPTINWAPSATASRTAHRLQLARDLLAEHPAWTGKISVRNFGRLLKPLLAADPQLTIGDLRHVLNHRPDGSAWWPVDRIRHLPAVLGHRLADWLGPDGSLVTDLPSRQARRDLAALRRDQDSHRRAAAAAEAGRLTPSQTSTAAARCRAALRNPPRQVTAPQVNPAKPPPFTT